MSIPCVTKATSHSEYTNKSLLLTDRDRTGLCSTDAGTLIMLNFNGDGRVTFHELSRGACKQVDLSLRRLGESYLGLKNPSLRDITRYLIRPEGEVERVLNCLRYKYLQAIFISGFECPQQYISHTYNKAFQTLAGLVVYQGTTKQRKPNDSYWRSAGFSAAARELNWEKEHHEMQRIIRVLKLIYPKPVTELYSELIAIKPGFHEMYLHKNFFNDDSIPTGTSLREEVLRMLRNKGEPLSLRLDELPAEINKNSYISFAACNVTEGPFVFRKDHSVSYFSEIRQVRSKKELPTLTDKFHILDYYNKDLSSREKLGDFLEVAKRFCGFIHDCNDTRYAPSKENNKMTINNLLGEQVIPAKRRTIRFKKIRAVYEKLVIAEATEKYLRSSARYSSPEQVFETFSFLRQETKEYFLAIHLDGKNRICCVDEVSVGSLNQSIVHPREVFKAALLSSAAAIILVHNHPTGDPTPSRDDIEITRRLKETGDVIGIRVLDHIIIGDSYASFVGQGLL